MTKVRDIRPCPQIGEDRLPTLTGRTAAYEGGGGGREAVQGERLSGIGAVVEREDVVELEFRRQNVALDVAHIEDEEIPVFLAVIAADELPVVEVISVVVVPADPYRIKNDALCSCIGRAPQEHGQ